MWMSTVIGVPSLDTLPETWTDDATSVTASVSCSTCAGVFDASPFDFAPPPQPASTTATPSITVAAPTRMSFSVSHTIAAMDARGIHHVGLAVEDLDEAVRTY